MLTESSASSTMSTEISEMTNFEIEELDEVFQDSKYKKHSVKNCLSRPFTITFRLWQILASLFIMVIIITVIGIVAGRFGPGSSNETRRVLPTSKPNRGNLIITFLPLRYLVCTS